MAKTTYRTDQVGSLLRPTSLLDARDAYRNGRLEAAELKRQQDAAILEALERQQQCGVDIYTDGEMRRDAWQTNFAHAADGFDPKYPILELPGPDGKIAKLEMHTQIINGKIARKGRIAEQDAVFLKKNSPDHLRSPCLAPTTSPTGYRPGITDKVYSDFSVLHSDVTGIMRGEMEALVADGASYIQLDEGFVYYVSSLLQSQVKVADLEKALVADIAAEILVMTPCEIRRPSPCTSAGAAGSAGCTAKRDTIGWQNGCSTRSTLIAFCWNTTSNTSTALSHFGSCRKDVSWCSA